MSYFKVSGITIDSFESRDFDKYVVIFTDKLGKINVKFKSVRKLTSRRIGLTQEFTIEKLLLYKKGNTFIATEVSLVKDFPNIKGSFQKMFVLLFMKKLLTTVIPMEQEDMQLYSFLEEFLEGFEVANESLSIEFLIYFLIKFLKLAGFPITFEGNINELDFSKSNEGKLVKISGIPVEYEVFEDFYFLNKIDVTSDIRAVRNKSKMLDILNMHIKEKFELEDYDKFVESIEKIL